MRRKKIREHLSFPLNNASMLKAILFYYKTAHFSAYNFHIHCKIKWIEKKFQKMGVTFKSLLTICDVLRNTPANPTNQFQIRHIGNDTAKLDKIRFCNKLQTRGTEL